MSFWSAPIRLSEAKYILRQRQYGFASRKRSSPRLAVSKSSMRPENRSTRKTRTQIAPVVRFCRSHCRGSDQEPTRWLGCGVSRYACDQRRFQISDSPVKRGVSEETARNMLRIALTKNDLRGRCRLLVVLRVGRNGIASQIFDISRAALARLVAVVRNDLVPLVSG